MPETDYAVEVLHRSYTDDGVEVWKVSSGYCVGGADVLTARHAVGSGEVFVRFWGGVELQAEVIAYGGKEVDLALVRMVGEKTPEAPRVRAARVDTSRATKLPCRGVGFPWWKEDEAERGRAQLSGYVPTAEGLVSQELTFHVDTKPLERPHAVGGSSWESASGTVVFTGDGAGGEFAIGVVVRHRMRDGASALTLEPLTSIDRMEDRESQAAFRAVLWPPGTNDLPSISGAAYPELPPPAPSTKMSFRRILAACTAGIVLVSGTLWWSAHQNLVADFLNPGDDVKVVLAGTSDPGEETRWWVLKDRVSRPKPDTSIPELASHESAPMLQHTIRLTLEGNSRSTVMITDIGAKIIGRRRSPYDGSAFMEPTQGSVGALGVGLDMEEDRPRARTYQEHTLGKHLFDDNGYTLAYKEVASVTVNVFAKQSLVRFALVVSYSVDGRMKRVPIMDKGEKPFILSGVPERLRNGVYVHWGALEGRDDEWVDEGPSTRADFADGTVRKRP